MNGQVTKGMSHGPYPGPCACAGEAIPPQFLLRRLRPQLATHVDSGICLQHITSAGRGQVENDVIGKAVQLSCCPTVTCHRIGASENIGRTAAGQYIGVRVEETGYVVGPERICATRNQGPHAVFEQPVACSAGSVEAIHEEGGLCAESGACEGAALLIDRAVFDIGPVERDEVSPSWAHHPDVARKAPKSEAAGSI